MLIKVLSQLGFETNFLKGIHFHPFEHQYHLLPKFLVRNPAHEESLLSSAVFLRIEKSEGNDSV